MKTFLIFSQIIRSLLCIPDGIEEYFCFNTFCYDIFFLTAYFQSSNVIRGIPAYLFSPLFPVLRFRNRLYNV